jgi:hypothetical protein
MDINYTITKTGNNTYELKYKLTENLVQQQQILNITKTDTDGTITAGSVQIAPASIASIVESPTAEPGTIVQGFPANLDVSNLAKGGTYYEIEETVGYYSLNS